MSKTLDYLSGKTDGDDRLRAKLRAFAGLAESLAALSTCKRLQVGCVAVTSDLSSVAAVGYNGPPVGLPNDGCRCDSPGLCGCCHGEASALSKPRLPRTDLVLIVTASPCEQCAGAIVNSGSVAAVLYRDEYRLPDGLDVLRRAGVVVANWGDRL